MSNRRILTWDGCVNVRDLGGLRTRDGRTTRWGALVRSDHPARLTAAGWSALHAHGIRTIISLRTEGIAEEDIDNAPRPPDITSLQIAIEDFTDTEFVRRWASTNLWGTPLYFSDALKRWPERHTAVAAAIARAQPGGVLFHCRRGYDRTGIIALLLLGLVGADPSDIVADYALSVDPERDALLEREGTTTREVIFNTLQQFNFEAYLLAGGLSRDDLATLRARILEPNEVP